MPQIAQYTHNTRKNHLQAGNAITDYLSDYLYDKTGIRVVFDQAQSKFRQVRLIADQRGAKVTLNPKPFCFTYDSKDVEKKTTTGVTNYKYSNYQLPENSIYSQFNNNNNILEVMLANDFTVVSESGNEIRVRHSSSNSDSSGVINVADNTYINYSSSFDSSGKTCFSPSDIVCKMQFDSD